MKDKLSNDQKEAITGVLKLRFVKNSYRHTGFEWANIEKRLLSNPEKLWSLYEMERTGGEPDIFDYDNTKDVYIFCDFSAESPGGRRSFCYDSEALESRKENKPKNSAVGFAQEMGVTLMNEEQYYKLQKIESVDKKTSSWILTPDDVRKHGGAIFGDFRYGRVFIYHNGAESYYAARGFRGIIEI